MSQCGAAAVGRGRGPVHGASAQAEPNPTAHVQKGKRHRKGAKRDSRGKASLMRNPKSPFFLFFPLPHPREELNSVILGGEATPALSTGSWNKWFVRFANSEKKPNSSLIPKVS